jgi:hypothetical protein
MKRASASSSEYPVPKRTKAGQACTACRRQKARCEILDDRPAPGVKIRCHRCKVLNIECSFENPHLIPFPPPIPPIQPSIPSPPELESHRGLNTLATVASSRPNVEEPAGSAIHSLDLRSKEQALTATAPTWGSVSRVDWTATPILAIQELVRCPRCETSTQPHNVGRLEDILSPSEITSLLEMFVFSLMQTALR